MKGNWTKAEALKEAKKYSTIGVFKKRNKTCYNFLVSIGVGPELERLMTPVKLRTARWTLETAKAEAKKYETRTALQAGAGGAYQWLRESGKLDEACEHMTLIKQKTDAKYSKERTLALAKQYPDLKSFRTNHRGDYDHARRNNYYNEFEFLAQKVDEPVEEPQISTVTTEEHASECKFGTDVEVTIQDSESTLDSSWWKERVDSHVAKPSPINRDVEFSRWQDIPPTKPIDGMWWDARTGKWKPKMVDPANGGFEVSPHMNSQFWDARTGTYKPTDTGEPLQEFKTPAQVEEAKDGIVEDTKADSNVGFKLPKDMKIPLTDFPHPINDTPLRMGYAGLQRTLPEVLKIINSGKTPINAETAKIMERLGKYKSVYNFKKGDTELYNRCRTAGVLDIAKNIVKANQSGVEVDMAETVRLINALERDAIPPQWKHLATPINPGAFKPKVKEQASTPSEVALDRDPVIVKSPAVEIVKTPALSGGVAALLEIMADLESNHGDVEYTIVYIPGVNWELSIEGKGSSNVDITRTAHMERRTVTTVKKFN